MEKIRVTLFGSLEVFCGEDVIDLPSSSAARSLLAYLLFYRSQSHSRSKLAGTFWPKMPETKARRALTQALYQIRQALPALIQADVRQIQISPDLEILVDREFFDAALSKSENPDQLQNAIDQYRDDLLVDFYDDWITLEREKLRGQYLHILLRLAQIHKNNGNYQIALDLVLKHCSVNVYQDSAHQEAMRLMMSLNRYQEALQHFETYRENHHREFNSGPDPETIALADEISWQLEQGRPTPFFQKTQLESSQSVQLPLIGRADERAQLLTFVEPIFDHQDQSGGMVILEGEAGVGKTRLVQEISRDIEWRGGQVLWGRADEIEATPPYGPLVNALSAGISPLRASQISQVIDSIWLQVLRPLFSTFSEHFPDLPLAPMLTRDQEKTRLAEAFVQFINGWTQFVPLVIIIENLQWTDPETLDLFPTLIRRLEKTSCVMIGTHRGEEVRSFPVLWEKLQSIDRAGLIGRLELTRLSDACTSELIRRTLGMGQPAPIFESRLYQETQGNPLFVLETLRALYDEKLLQRDEAGTWTTPWDESTTDYTELPLPPAVDQVIQRRLSRLLPDFIHTLQVAAVLGSEFDFELLLAGCRLESADLILSIRELVRRHFIHETPQNYQFSHDKIRQVTYQWIEPKARVKLHRKIGAVIEAQHPNQYLDLAHHFSQGQVWDKAVKYYQQAGDQAAQICANQDAITHFTKALEILEQIDDPEKLSTEFDLRISCETVLYYLGDRSSQAREIAKLDRIANQLDDDQKRCEVALCQAEYSNIIGDYPAALISAKLAVELSRKLGDQSNEAIAHRCWGEVLQYQGDYDGCEDHLQQARTLAQKTNDRRSEGNLELFLGNNAYRIGDFSSALVHYQQALKIGREVGSHNSEGNALNNIGLVLRNQNDYDQAKEHFEMALEIGRKTGYRLIEGQALGNLGIFYAEQGFYFQARNYIEEELRICQEINDQSGVARLFVNLGAVTHRMGNYTQAESYFAQALQLAGKIGETRIKNFALAYSALVNWHLKNSETAQKYALDALSQAQEVGDRYAQASALIYLGHIKAQFEHCPHFASEPIDVEMTERLSQAADAYQQALEIRGELGLTHMTPEPLAGLARIALAQGELDRARQYVDKILDILENGSLNRADEPYRVWLTCYHVLRACALKDSQKKAEADNFLREIYDLLQEQAGHIEDPVLRGVYLNNIPSHREIITAYQELKPDKMIVRLPRIGVPTGRPLQDDEWVVVKWTVSHPEDNAVSGKADQRQTRLLRLVGEAESQGAAPTVDALAEALKVSKRTIKRDLAKLREAGHTIQTRGSRN